MPRRVQGPWRGATSLLCMLTLAACAGGHGRVASHRIAPPGEAGDPWGPYIHEASGRFGVPEQWIRAVMQQESGGRQFIDGQQTTSSAGAMGLMQVVPDTYAGLRDRYGLGGDPYDPHDNIMAGTAYIREMYDRFGAPGFLAAYNAGPRRLDSYLNDGQPLPAETVGYLASVAPRLGPDAPMTGPLASYAGRAGTRYAAASPPPAPPLAPPLAPVLAPARDEPRPAPELAADPPSAYQAPPPPAPAYQPPASALAMAHPSVPPPVRAASASAPPPPFASAPSHPPAFVPAPFVIPPAPRSGGRAGPGGGWAIQVGAFATPAMARDAADAARQRLAGAGESAVGVAARPGGGVLFRARVTGLSAESARSGCGRVEAAGAACIVISPESS